MHLISFVFYYFFEASDNIEPPILVEIGQVSSVKPLVGINCLFCGFFIIQIAFHYHRAANAQLADLVHAKLLMARCCFYHLLEVQQVQ